MALVRRCCFFLAFAAAIILVSTPGRALTDQEEIIQLAHISVQKILQHKDIGPSVRDLLGRAKGIMIFPNLYKGAIFFGAEGGSGLLMAKGSGGRWSYPAFYYMGSGSFGLQLGAQTAEVMLMIMTERGLNAIINQKVKVGGEVNAAIGPYGVGGEASTTMNLGADIFTYSINEGAFVGFSVEGAVIYPRKEWTSEYYGNPEAGPRAVVIDGRFRNGQADILRKSLVLER